jgi:hypothetical protein
LPTSRKIHEAARDFEKLDARVAAVEADLATLEGVDKVLERIGGRGRAAGRCRPWPR